ncbi:MAG: HAD family hydrolase [Pseudomonadota bacterium]
MKLAILFDLGNTLVAYYRREEFRPVLEQAIQNILDELNSSGIRTVSSEQAMQTALAENREAGDYQVTQITQRFERIFKITLQDEHLTRRLCEHFLTPIFAMSYIYEDVLPTLAQLKASGYVTAIISNAPWGSPANLWRDELSRLGLTGQVDEVVFCTDVGWRKPDARIFLHTVEQLGVECNNCIFVGDDPEWDIAGSVALGMRPVLIDRDNHHTNFSGERILGLDELLLLIQDK